MKTPVLLALLCAISATADAQASTLKWRLDSPAVLVTGAAVSDSAWRFSPMAPGWHVTTRPGVLLYDPTQTGSGQYSVDTQIHIFPNSSDAGMGIFIGGQNIESDAPSYWLFEIRQNGAYRISQRETRNERVIRDWVVDTTIIKHPGGNTTVANRIRVMVRPDSIVLIVNTKPIVAVPRTGPSADGAFGLRVGSRVDVHVSHLDFIRHLAPIRSSP